MTCGLQLVVTDSRRCWALNSRSRRCWRSHSLESGSASLRGGNGSHGSKGAGCDDDQRSADEAGSAPKNAFDADTSQEATMRSSSLWQCSVKAFPGYVVST
ncbi:unnamed protein product (mitochondrion) [Plasmodiophora brassicae]|uniref:Uncharacterized protein n=1 Tax=Plasmodiophora brassicae TaxID=37360 RepID=A0A3P3YH58_PLABS|nr:unnamed protein product [Plasmodiophora brassicae]